MAGDPHGPWLEPEPVIETSELPGDLGRLLDTPLEEVVLPELVQRLGGRLTRETGPVR